jgi:N-carbamoyl-L-amino-acid hydrolase
MDGDWVARLKRHAKALGLPGEEVPSGAGHDAAVFANAGVPSAMIFVRNENGSHNPAEAMDLDDFSAALALMRSTIEEAAQ